MYRRKDTTGTGHFLCAWRPGYLQRITNGPAQLVKKRQARSYDNHSFTKRQARAYNNCFFWKKNLKRNVVIRTDVSEISTASIGIHLHIRSCDWFKIWSTFLSKINKKLFKKASKKLSELLRVRSKQPLESSLDCVAVGNSFQLRLTTSTPAFSNGFGGLFERFLEIF